MVKYLSYNDVYAMMMKNVREWEKNSKIKEGNALNLSYHFPNNLIFMSSLHGT